MITVQGMIFGGLLRQHGIASAAERGRRLDIARQHMRLLWTGRRLPSYEILQRLAAMDIDPQDFAKLERAKPPTNGRRRKGHPGTCSTGEEGEDCT
jgi:transcriptional regulator with XRE-family HTH domain